MLTKDYEEKTRLASQSKQSQTNPISTKAQTGATSILKKDYERIGACGVQKSKAKQSQSAQKPEMNANFFGYKEL